MRRTPLLAAVFTAALAGLAMTFWEAVGAGTLAGLLVVILLGAWARLKGVPKFLRPTWLAVESARFALSGSLNRRVRSVAKYLPTVNPPERSVRKSVREWRDRKWPRPEPPEGSKEAAKLRKLKRQALNLSHDIAEWHRKEAPHDQTEKYDSMSSPPWSNVRISWVRTRQDDTMAEYERQFAFMVELSRESLAKAGYTDPNLDKHYEKPKDLADVQVVYERLRVVAERLPD